jgi:hypothetical protein
VSAVALEALVIVATLLVRPGAPVPAAATNEERVSARWEILGTMLRLFGCVALPLVDGIAVEDDTPGLAGRRTSDAAARRTGGAGSARGEGR